MKAYYSLLLTGLALCASCSLFNSKSKENKEEYSENRTRMEAEAQRRLQSARRQLLFGQTEAARATIRQMREDCYLALSARSEGILLMDSIDLQTAKDELARVDSLLRIGADSVDQEVFDEACRKVQFYERKLQHDKKPQSGAPQP